MSLGLAGLDKTTDVASALAGRLHPAMRVLVGGFGERGFPFTLNHALLEAAVGGLHLVKSDGNEDGLGIGLLIEAGLVARVTASHVGLNRGLVERVNTGAVELEMVPQGILAERIRAGGAGLGGVLSDVGIGTLIAEGKSPVCVDGAEYVVEPAIRGDLALIRAARADRFGNLVYRNAARNFNPLMAMAADYVVVEAEEIIATGELDPNEVHTPGVFVDAVVPVDPAVEAAA
ncbi:MAG TPA: 3-oxoacid CoA-transferase subunit A [Arenicellales bacterium]|nr:3-oxoacid CoA-transferase subunit A [Arenicellales bacterium]